MAELNARIIAKASATASEEPLAADLEVAELAVNTADGKLFTKHTDGSIVTISGGGGGSVDDVLGAASTGEFYIYSGVASSWVKRTMAQAAAGVPSGLSSDIFNYNLVGQEGFYADDAAWATDGWTVFGGTNVDDGVLDASSLVPNEYKTIDYLGVSAGSGWAYWKINSNGGFYIDQNSLNLIGRGGTFTSVSQNAGLYTSCWVQDTRTKRAGLKELVGVDGTDWMVIRAEMLVPYSSTTDGFPIEWWFGKNGKVRLTYGAKIGVATVIGTTSSQGIASYGTEMFDFGSYVDQNGGVSIEAGFSSGMPAFNIGDVADVDTATAAPTDGQVLTWVAANSQWEPVTPSGGGGVIVPATAPPTYDDETGTQGELRFDADYLYLCIATDSWKRSPLTAWGSTPGGGAGDPNWANVALLLHGEGADASTTFTDSSNNNLTASLTAYDSAQISTAQAKFGTSSLDFNSGTNASVRLLAADSDALDIASNEDFTYEWWMYVTQFGTGDPSGISTWIISEFNGSSDFHWNLTSTASGSGLCAISFAMSYSSAGMLTHQDAVPTNTWVHFAHVRSGGINKIYVNGVASTGSVNQPADLDNSGYWSIGPRGGGTHNRLYVDDVRLTIGVARYTADFTPPTAVFPDS